MQCNAKSKQSGKRCKRPATLGSTKCYIHGGKSLKGIASPSLKTGRHSKYLPQNLQAVYQASIADSELLATRHEIALVDTLIIDIIPKLDSGESGKSWGLMRKSVDGLQLAMGHEDFATCEAMIRQMRDVIDKKVAHYATQEEIQSLIDQRRKLAESERKRLIEMQQSITAEQAMLLVGGLLDSVRRNVTDRDALTAIQTDFIRYTTFSNSERTEQTELTESTQPPDSQRAPTGNH